MAEFVQSKITVIKPDRAISRGQRMSIRPVDDAACLTEEDKKRLLQEFTAEEE